jgi:hypothetical protein
MASKSCRPEVVRASRRLVRGREGDHLPAGRPRLGPAIVLADDEQARVLFPAERAGEGAAVQLDRGQHSAALPHPYTMLVAHVGVPDSALGIDADPVRMVTGRLRPHPPVAKAAVCADVIGRELAGVGLGNDERPAVRGDRHPVRERQVAGDLSYVAIRRGQHDKARREFAAGELEADGVDVGVAPVVDHDVIPWLGRDFGQVSVRDQRAVGLTAQQSPLRRVHHQQPPVREEVDAHRERCDGHDHFAAAVGTEREDLIRAPVREPEPSVVPAR